MFWCVHFHTKRCSYINMVSLFHSSSFLQKYLLSHNPHFLHNCCNQHHWKCGRISCFDTTKTIQLIKHFWSLHCQTKIYTDCFCTVSFIFFSVDCTFWIHSCHYLIDFWNHHCEQSCEWMIYDLTDTIFLICTFSYYKTHSYYF